MTGTHRVAARPTAALVTALLGAVALALTGPDARADGDAAAEGVYVTVANPITSEVTNRVKERVDRAVREHKVQKVIFDFNPDNREANSPNFGPCSDLADYILDHPQLVTVAFVHGKVCRHTVLPALACKEMVMSREASIGEVPAPDVAGPITPGTYDSLKRRVRRAVSRGANVIFLQLDGCGGGETESARDVAEFLRTLHDERPDHDTLPVVTVAFIPHEAPDTATFVA